MDTRGTTQRKIGRSREDSAGDFVLHLSNTILALAAVSLTISLLGALQSFADGSAPTTSSMLVVAMWSAIVFTASAAWSALWAKLKRMADDLHAIRQHVEKTKDQ